MKISEVEKAVYTHVRLSSDTNEHERTNLILLFAKGSHTYNTISLNIKSWISKQP